MSGVLNKERILSTGLLYIKNQKNINIFEIEIVLASQIYARFDNPKMSKNLLPVDLSPQNSTTEVMLELCDPLFYEQQMALLLGAIFYEPQKKFPLLLPRK